VNTPHAIAIDAAALAALRQHGTTQARIDALCASTGPLNPADRQSLEDALQVQQERHRHAEAQILKIVARLARE
jgi:hypothetical protein